MSIMQGTQSMYILNQFLRYLTMGVHNAFYSVKPTSMHLRYYKMAKFANIWQGVFLDLLPQCLFLVQCNE